MELHQAGFLGRSADGLRPSYRPNWSKLSLGSSLVGLWTQGRMFLSKTIKSFDYVIMIIDLADEILEFTNLVVVTLFFPFLPPWDIYDDLLYL